MLKKAGDKYKLLVDQPANWARALGRTVTQDVLTWRLFFCSTGCFQRVRMQR
jgi:hypothetical protein